MINLVNTLTEHIRDKHCRLQILLYSNNLATHISNTIKSNFAASKVFLCYFLPSTKELT